MNSIQQKAPHEYADGYRDALAGRSENPRGCEMYALGYAAGFEASLGVEFQARLVEDLRTLARADEKRAQIPAIEDAFALWNARLLYVDKLGNYRVKANTTTVGHVAPMNGTLREMFRSVGDFARAAKRAEVLKAA